MKKLLSAVTSTVMGVSLMTGAFVPPVSAAGGYAAAQPNVSIGGALDVAANKTDDGGVVFDFGNYTTEAGKKFNVSVKANTSGLGIAGMDVNFKIDSPLKIVGIAEESPAFSQSVMTNMNNLGANFTAIQNGSGSPIVPSADEATFVLQVEVPANTPSGDYKISFGNKVEIFKDSTKNTVPATVQNGTITVTNPNGDTTSQNQTTQSTTKTTTNTTKNDTPATTSAQNTNADVIFDFGNYNTEAGKSVKVQVKADSKGKGIAAMDVVFKVDSPLVYKGVAEESPAFGMSVMSNNEILGANFTAIKNGSGDPITPSADEATFVLLIDVPASTPNGTYKVGFGNKCEVFKDSSQNTLSTSSINGNIVVGGVDATTSSKQTEKPAQTTSAEEKPAVTTTVDTSKADVVFDFGNYQTDAGKSVKVQVKTDSKGKGIAAMDVIFKVDSPLVYKGVAEESPAFGMSVMSNNEILGANFTAIKNGSGDPITPSADEATFVLLIDVPANTPDGDYYVGFDSKCEVFKDSSQNTYKTAFINGKITVGSPTNDKTTASTAPTTSKEAEKTTVTTKTAPVADGTVTFDFQNYKAKPGDDVTVNILVDSDNNPIAGMDVKFKLDSPLVMKGIAEESPAFGQAVMVNLDVLGANFTAIKNGSGEAIVPTKTDAVFVVKVNVPANTPAGDYKIQFGDKCEVIKDSTNALYKATSKNGTITVEDITTTSKKDDTTTTSKKDDVTTSSSTNTTTASKPIATVTTVKADPVSGSADWVIPKMKAAPGEQVVMDVIVKNSDIEVSGAQFNITADKAIGAGKSTSGKAYEVIVPNDKEQLYAFGQDKGKGVKADDNAVIITMTYTVPANTAKGVYPVKWSNAFITDTNGNDITSKINLVDGEIEVTEAPEVEGEIQWVLDNKTAKPGDTVVINAVVDNGSGKGIDVAGAQFIVNAESPIGYVSAADGDAYKSAFIKNNDEHFFAFGQDIGKGETAADGKTVISITYKVPEDCKDGVYPIKWSNAFITDTNGNSLNSNVKLVDGSITVGKIPENTDTIKWVIPKVNANPGDTVKMDVKVDGTGKVNVSGAQFIIKNADGVTYVDADGTPYGSDLVKNNTEKYFAFARAIGDPFAASNGDVIFTLTYQVPEDASGEYPITWSDAGIFDTNGSSILKNIDLVDGAIIVTAPITSSTSATESTSAKGDETTSTSVTSVTESIPKADDSTTSTTATNGSETTTTSTTGDITAPKPTTSAPIESGKIAWKAETVETEAGSNVDLKIVIADPEGVKLPIAGGFFTVVNENSENIKPTDVAKEANSYGGTVVFNPTTNEYAFANSTGVNVASEDGKTVVTISYSVSKDCAPGEYKVDLGGIKIFDTEGNDISSLISDIDGAIIVKETPVESDVTTESTTTATGTETATTSVSTTETGTGSVTESTTSVSTTETGTGTATESTTSVSTTETGTGTATESTTSVSVTETGTGSETSTTVTSSTTGKAEGSTTTSTVTDTNTTTSVTETTSATTTVKGAVIWQGETVKAQPGQTVKVKFAIEDDQNAGLPVAGAQFTVKCELGNGTVDPNAVNGYGATIVANQNANEYAFANPTGAQVKSENGKTVIELEFAIPADAAPGEYPVDIDSVKVFDTNGTDISDHVIAKDGKIVIEEVVTTTTTTTTGSDTTGSTTSSTVSSTDTNTGSTVTESTTSNTGSTGTDTTASTTTGTDTTATESTTSITDTTTSTSTTDGGTTSSTDTTVTESTTTNTDTTATESTTSSTDTTVTESTTSSTDTTATESTTSSTDTTATESTTSSTDTTATESTTTNTDTTATESTTSSTDTTATESTNTNTTSSTDTTSTTSTTGPVQNEDILPTTTSVIIGPTPTYTPYYTVEAVPGYYFSHDNGERANGVKGGFDPHQITKIVKHVLDENGVEISKTEYSIEEILDRVSFGNATPYSVYHDRFGKNPVNDTVEADDFKYEIPVFIDDVQLWGMDGKPATITAYIGVKGDTNLDFIVDGRDASDTLTYYAKISTVNYGKKTTAISTSALVSGADDPLDDLAAFLSDVNENEWSADNWSKPRENRTLDGNDATAILTFYARTSASSGEYKDYDDNQLWNSVLGTERFGQ